MNPQYCPICNAELRLLTEHEERPDSPTLAGYRIVALRCDPCSKQTRWYDYIGNAASEAARWNADAGFCPVCAKPLESVAKRDMTGTRCNTCRRTDYARPYATGLRYMEDGE